MLRLCSKIVHPLRGVSDLKGHNAKMTEYGSNFAFDSEWKRSCFHVNPCLRQSTCEVTLSLNKFSDLSTTVPLRCFVIHVPLSRRACPRGLRSRRGPLPRARTADGPAPSSGMGWAAGPGAVSPAAAEGGFKM